MTDENYRALLPSCLPALCLPWAGFQAQGLPAHPCCPHTAAVTLLGQGRSLAHHGRNEAPLAPHQTKDQGSCWTGWICLAPTMGLALWHVLFPSSGLAHVAHSPLAQ